jgi:hypothetical protein
VLPLASQAEQAPPFPTLEQQHLPWLPWPRSRERRWTKVEDAAIYDFAFNHLISDV